MAKKIAREVTPLSRYLVAACSRAERLLRCAQFLTAHTPALALLRAGIIEHAAEGAAAALSAAQASCWIVRKGRRPSARRMELFTRLM